MIRPTTPNDLLELRATVRPEDAKEVLELSGLSVFEALSYGYMAADEIFTGEQDGRVVCIFGVVGTSVWLLSSPQIASAKRQLITEGRKWLDEMVAKYGPLSNVITADNEVHIRLAKHLGFKLGQPITTGPLRVLAVPIERD